MPQGIHDGHRQRLRDRFLKTGLESFEDHQVLELLLFYAIPRKDTNELAHHLLKHFGSLSAVLEATAQDLSRVEGIGMQSASLIALCGQLVKRYHLDKRSNVRAFASIDEVGNYLQPLFLNEKVEKAVVVCVNNRCELLGCTTLSTGTVSGTDARTREIAEAALAYHATGIILAHNHPSGFAIPSSQDLETTRTLVHNLNLLDVQLLDHLIFTATEFISLRQSPRYAAAFSRLGSL